MGKLLSKCAAGDDGAAAHIAATGTNLKINYTTGELDAEAEVIAAVNAINTRVNQVSADLGSVLIALENAGILKTA